MVNKPPIVICASIREILNLLLTILLVLLTCIKYHRTTSTFIIYVFPLFRKHTGLRAACIRHHSLHEGDVELLRLRL